LETFEYIQKSTRRGVGEEMFERRKNLFLLWKSSNFLLILALEVSELEIFTLLID
jgi:hypothetical protein